MKLKSSASWISGFLKSIEIPRFMKGFVKSITFSLEISDFKIITIYLHNIWCKVIVILGIISLEDTRAEARDVIFVSGHSGYYIVLVLEQSISSQSGNEHNN